MWFPQFANNALKSTHISFAEKSAYGIGDFASNLLYAPVNSLLLFYYSEYVNVSLGIVATIILISRILDWISDIVAGFLVERTSSPYGKTRVWILRLCIPFAISLVALFSVPYDAPDWIKYIYIFVTYNFAITIVFTAINVPYGVLAGLMTFNKEERSLLVIFRMVCATCGSTFVITATLPLVELFGNDRLAWSIVFSIYAIVGCVAFFITFVYCHERLSSVEAPNYKVPKVTIKKSLFYLLKNTHWIKVTCVFFCICSTDTIFATVNTYYCHYFLKNAQFVGHIAFIVFIFKILTMILILPKLITKIGKRNTLFMSLIIAGLGLTLRYLDPYSLNVNYVLAALLGIGQGMMFPCVFAMILDTVEYGEYINRHRQEGLVLAGASFGSKIAAGIGAFLPAFFIKNSGYINNAPEQTSIVMDTIMQCGSWLAIVFLVIAFISLIGYRIDEIYDDIVAELRRRNLKRAYRLGYDFQANAYLSSYKTDNTPVIKSQAELNRLLEATSIKFLEKNYQPNDFVLRMKAYEATYLLALENTRQKDNSQLNN